MPDFKQSYRKDWECSNNLWNGENPKSTGKLSVALLLDDWLCKKTEFESYRGLSRSQELGGLKINQFVRVPKSQSKWYDMHWLRSDSPPHPAEPSSIGGMKRQSSMRSTLTWLCQVVCLHLAPHPIQFHRIPRGDGNIVPKRILLLLTRWLGSVYTPLKFKNRFLMVFLYLWVHRKSSSILLNLYVKDSISFHQSISVDLCTHLQHLADSLFMHLGNLVLLRKDTYLDHLDQGWGAA